MGEGPEMRSAGARQETLHAPSGTDLRLLSPELGALAACMRNGSSPPADLDWGGLQRLAIAHGVAPVVHQAWRNRLEMVPPAVLLEFKRLRQVYALRGVLGLQQRDEILRTFQEARIPCLVLKGAALARTWYADLSLRPFVDIDLLLPAHELDRARRLLMQAGYEETSNPRTPYHEAPLQRAGMPCSVELHHSLTAQSLRAGVAFDDLYGRSVVVEKGIRTLAPEDTLLHLCLHLLGHVKLTQGWKLSYLLDIKRHIEAFPIDWDNFAHRAREAGASRGCGSVLGAAALVVNAEVPSTQIDGAAAWELLRYPVPDLLDVSHHFLAAFLAALARADFGQAVTIFLRAMIDSDERQLGVHSLRPHLLVLNVARLLHETVKEPRYLRRQLQTWLPQGEGLVEREHLIADLLTRPDA